MLSDLLIMYDLQNTQPNRLPGFPIKWSPSHRSNVEITHASTVTRISIGMQNEHLTRSRGWKVKHHCRFDRDGQTIGNIFEGSTRQTLIQNITHLRLRIT
jgi:hypothetical protein